jgi:hypothetical protein
MEKLTWLTSIFAVVPLVAAAQRANGDPDSPFMCNLKALSPSERAEHEQLAARMTRAVVATREISDGYAFELDATHMSMTDLARWSEFERRCCPFFDFSLESRRENGPLTLRLTGRHGVKQFIRAEFPKIFAER